MKKELLCVLFLLPTFTGMTTAQQLIPFVVSSSGGFYSSSSGMLSFTTGEMSAVETYTSPNTILTQGFQQSWDFGTYITGHPNHHFAFGVYPNPSDGLFSLLTETEENIHVGVKISDLLGREVQQIDFFQHDKMHVQSFDISHIAPGMYLITLTVRERKTSSEFQFVKKIQVIK